MSESEASRIRLIGLERPRDREMHFGRAPHRSSRRNITEILSPAHSRSRGSFPDRLIVTLERKS